MILIILGVDEDQTRLKMSFGVFAKQPWYTRTRYFYENRIGNSKKTLRFSYRTATITPKRLRAQFDKKKKRPSVENTHFAITFDTIR